jgi:hypothetical protein
MKENKLKKITTQRSELSRDIKSLKDQQEDINKLILLKRQEISNLDKQINLISKGFAISEHAILRILERAYEHGDIIEKIKKQLEDEIKPKLESLNVVSAKVNLKCGLTAVVENNLLVTII